MKAGLRSTIAFFLGMGAALGGCIATGSKGIRAQTSSAGQPLSSQTLKVLVESVRQKYALPALGVAVIQANKVLVATSGVRKYGDPTPVTDDDKFHLGSCTKSMTATLIAMLVEDGTLKWDTTIESVFPELAEKMRAEYRPVTLQQLLRHRGGLPHETMPNGSSFDTWRRSTEPLPAQRLAYLQLMLREAPEAAPGKAMIYSNAGYIVAAAMVERRTGKSWEELIRKRLFEPLGMTSAGFGPMAGAGKIDQPWSHVWNHDRWQPIAPGPDADNPQVIGPAGTVHTSMGDWAKYARFHLRGLRGEEPLLPAKSFQKLHERPKGSDYALGWSVLSRPWAGGTVLQHNGSNTMNYSVIWLAPLRNFGVLIATNASDPDNVKSAAACDEVAAEVVTRWLAESAPKNE